MSLNLKNKNNKRRERFFALILTFCMIFNYFTINVSAGALLNVFNKLNDLVIDGVEFSVGDTTFRVGNIASLTYSQARQLIIKIAPDSEAAQFCRENEHLSDAGEEAYSDFIHKIAGDKAGDIYDKLSGKEEHDAKKDARDATRNAEEEKNAFFNAWLEDKDLGVNLKGKGSEVSDSAYNAVTSLYTGGTKVDAQDLINQLTLEKDGETIYAAAYNACDYIYQIIQPLGYALLIIYWLTKLLDDATSDRFNPEIFLKSLMMLMIGIYFVSVFPNLFDKLVRGFNVLIKSIANPEITTIFKSVPGEDAYKMIKSANGSDYTYLKRIAATALNNNFIGNISVSFLTAERLTSFNTNVLTWIIMKLGNYLIILIAFTVSLSRLIKIPIYYAVAPIGIAGIVRDGVHGPGIRYVKKFISLLLQGALIIICLSIYNSITSASATYNSSFLQEIAPILAGFALISVIKSTDDIAERVMG